MKKYLLAILVALSLSSCKSSENVYTWVIEVEVHYPDRTDTLQFQAEFYGQPKVESSQGSSQIYYYAGQNGGHPTLIETTAPMNIIKATQIPDKQWRQSGIGKQ